MCTKPAGIRGVHAALQGLWDSVSLATTHDIVITDPWVRTLSVTGRQPTGGAVAKNKHTAVVAPAAFVSNRGNGKVTGTLLFELVTTGKPETAVVGMAGVVVARASCNVTLASMEVREVQLGNVTVHNATLWWPHTHGTGPYLYTARFTFTAASAAAVAAESSSGQGASQGRHRPPPFSGDYHHADIAGATPAPPIAAVQLAVGVRSVVTVVDEVLGGRVFQVNGQRIFLEGGNWIHTDQLLRHATNQQRYSDEVCRSSVYVPF